MWEGILEQVRSKTAPRDYYMIAKISAQGRRFDGLAFSSGEQRQKKKRCIRVKNKRTNKWEWQESYRTRAPVCSSHISLHSTKA